MENTGQELVWFDDLQVSKSAQRLQVISYADYYPFGDVMEERNEYLVSHRFGYQGEFAERDAETGWNAFELRQYDSKAGRWLSTDPYGQYWSPYVGMGNDPVNMFDPDGGFAGGGGGLVSRGAGLWNKVRAFFSKALTINGSGNLVRTSTYSLGSKFGTSMMLGSLLGSLGKSTINQLYPYYWTCRKKSWDLFSLKYEEKRKNIHPAFGQS